MKVRIVAKLSLIYVFIVTGLSSAAQSKYADGEALARAFLEHTTVCYRGTVSAQLLNGAAPSHLQMSFGMNLALRLTNLSVNGTNIPLPRPLLGIPVPEQGYASFVLSLTGIDSYGESVSSGVFAVEQLQRSNIITVTLVPQFPPVFIPSPVSDSQSVTLVLAGTDNWSATFDSVKQGYLVYIMDGSTDVEYEIELWNGIILARGRMPTFEDASKSTDPVVNVLLAGNVVDARLGEKGDASFPNRNFDGSVIRSETDIPAKVFIVPDLNRTRLYVWLTGIRGASAEVRTADMKLVAMTTKDYGSGIEMISAEPMDKALVTVLPGAETNISRPFSIYFGRQR